MAQISPLGGLYCSHVPLAAIYGEKVASLQKISVAKDNLCKDP